MTKTLWLLVLPAGINSRSRVDWATSDIFATLRWELDASATEASRTPIPGWAERQGQWSSIVKDEKQIEPAASSAPTSAPPLDRSPFKSDEEYQEALAFRKH